MSLEDALKRVQRETGVNLVFSGELVRNRVTAGVSGQLTAEDAIRKLLEGTNLEVKSNGGAVFVVVERKDALREATPKLKQAAGIDKKTASSTSIVQPQLSVVEEVVVTGTLIVRDGYQAPTPVTVLGLEQVQASAPATLADFVNFLPSMGGSTTTHQAGGGISDQNKGTNSLNLRGLGTSRTLVLLDGVRMPPVNLNGTSDISGIPESLIQRIDVVTGGASAAYGSDAMAGVVNFVLDKNFTGVRGQVQGGITSYWDNPTGNIRLTVGAPFGGGKGHLLASGDWTYIAGIFPKSLEGHKREWVKQGWMLIPNPSWTSTNGLPRLIVSTQVGVANQTPGGLINSGPLKGIYFGAGGAPALLNYGLTDNSTMIGGDWKYTSYQYQNGVDQRNRRYSVFLRGSYDLTDDINVWLQASSSQSAIDYQCCANFTQASLTIKADNAFIPAQVSDSMSALALTSFTLGTYHHDIGLATSHNTRAFSTYAVGAKGKVSVFGDDWTWDVFAQYGFSKASFHLTNIFNRAKILEAIDAVRLSSGAIVCRSTLTSPNNGCVPYNVMGTDVNSQAAINYVTGEAFAYQPYRQTAFGLKLAGEPLSSWAGPISVALGVNQRRDSTKGINDPISQQIGWFAGNYLTTRGSFTVIEGFGETVIPLAKDTSWARNLDLNTGVRAVSYQQAGYETTWKVGLTYGPVDDVRIRMTQSHDIRAPNLGDLFSGGGGASYILRDPLLGDISYGLNGGSFGNPKLKPEKADSTGVGVVYRPKWLSGFTTSIDYYKISIRDAIAVVSVPDVVLRCYGGEPQFCPGITRDPVTNRITFVRSSPFNIVTERATGFDAEATYRASLEDIVPGWRGQLALRALGTYYITDKTNDGRRVIEKAGTNSNTGIGPQKWKATLSATYSLARFSFTLNERLISSGKFSNEWIECQSNCPAENSLNRTVNLNHIEGAAYTDLSASYRFGEDANIEAFLSIQNVANTDPAFTGPTTPAGTPYAIPTNSVIYDVLGRQFRAGVRFRM